MTDQSKQGSAGDYRLPSADDVKGMAADAMQTAAKKGSELLDEGRDMTTHAMSNVTERVKENPVITLAAVALMGVAIGALWKMKSRDTMYDRLSRQMPRNWRDMDPGWLQNLRWR